MIQALKEISCEWSTIYICMLVFAGNSKDSHRPKPLEKMVAKLSVCRWCVLSVCADWLIAVSQSNHSDGLISEAMVSMNLSGNVVLLQS